MFITGVCVLLLIKRKVADELREIWTTNISYCLLIGNFKYSQSIVFRVVHEGMPPWIHKGQREGVIW